MGAYDFVHGVHTSMTMVAMMQMRAALGVCCDLTVVASSSGVCGVWLMVWWLMVMGCTSV